MEAMMQLLAAAAEAERNLIILIDNSSVLNGLLAAIRGEPQMPKYGFGRLVRVLELLQGRSHRAFWVPSHGKNPAWKAISGDEETTRLWRELNEEADKQAGKGGDQQMRRYGLEAWAGRWESAKDWTGAAFDRVYSLAHEYISGDPLLVEAFSACLAKI